MIQSSQNGATCSSTNFLHLFLHINYIPIFSMILCKIFCWETLIPWWFTERSLISKFRESIHNIFLKSLIIKYIKSYFINFQYLFLEACLFNNNISPLIYLLSSLNCMFSNLNSFYNSSNCSYVIVFIFFSRFFVSVIYNLNIVNILNKFIIIFYYLLLT